MDKESGVYITITDNSFSAGMGSGKLKVLVPMLTTKGKLGLNKVDANNFKDVLGYDLNYNPNYYGLEQILSYLSEAMVWRLNDGTKLANAWFADSSSDKSSEDDAETFDDLTEMDPKPLLAVALKDPGDPGTFAVKLAPLPAETAVLNENPSVSFPQTSVFDDVSQSEKTAMGGVEVNGGCVFYNFSNNAVVGAIKKDKDGNWKVYKVSDGQVIEDEITIATYNSWTDGTKIYNAELAEIIEPEGEPEDPVSIGNVRVSTLTGYEGMYKSVMDGWRFVTSFSPTEIITSDTPATDPDLIAALEAAPDVEISYVKYVDETVTEDNSCGTAEWNESKLTVVLTKSLSTDSFYTVHTIPTTIVDWTLTLSEYNNSQYTVKKRFDFSTNSESTIYWKDVDFGDVQFFLSGAIPSNWEAVRDYFTLDNGSNGSKGIVAANIDTTPLEKCGCNVCAMNGITSYAVINKIAKKAETLFIHVFADAPAYSAYEDVATWIGRIYRSQYLAVGARPDKIELDDNGNYLYLYPSVNYVSILSRMLQNYQYVYYPPAGFTYGTISAENLIECDYEKYGDELKTSRVNWQRTKSRGSVMWEQRTTYSLDTDLSYIAPTFIVDGLREDLINFEEQFNFRYSSPTDLLNQESGLKSILDDYVTKGFLYSYKLQVPSYAEAQKQGRTLTINIEVVLMKDAEVIYINLNLNNAQ